MFIGNLTKTKCTINSIHKNFVYTPIYRNKYLSHPKYEDVYGKSINISTQSKFWKNQAEDVEWFNFPNQILNSEEKPFYKWYADGKINMNYNCFDKHILNNNGQSNALIWRSAYPDKNNEITPDQVFSFDEGLFEVSRIAKLMREKFNVKTGDRVVIYMPNIPEAFFTMQACARIGAIHCVVFGGFAAEELATRIKDCNPKLIVTASVGLEPNKKIAYLPIIKKALSSINALGNIPILISQRSNYYEEKEFSRNENVNVFEELIDKISSNINKEDLIRNKDKLVNLIPAEHVDSNHPLYILYTSGTTGAPKGVYRDTGGSVVALNFSAKNILGLDLNDTMFTTADIGWVVGHSFLVYAPLIRGAASIMFEGKPIGTPDSEAYWRLVEKYKPKSIFTAPTAIRAIKKVDYNGDLARKYNLSSLKVFNVAGERCDVESMKWIHRLVSQECMVNDNWWQTETGWPISSNFITNKEYTTFHIPLGYAGKPCPGYDIRIYDSSLNKELWTPDILGNIYIKLPMPPSFMLGIWNNKDGFKEKYLTKDEQYYITGDAGSFNEDGFLIIDARIDDVINVAGHRLSTSRIEEVLIKNSFVAESAVVSLHDDLKGELPFAFVVWNDSFDHSNDEARIKLIEDCKEEVIDFIGNICRLKEVVLVNKLPKTRSGKILRKVLKKIVNKEHYTVPSTIEDLSVLEDIKNQLILKKLI